MADTRSAKASRNRAANIPDDDNSSLSSESGVGELHLGEDDTWGDVEDDEEQIRVVSLFDDAEFGSVKSALEYCTEKYAFDLLGVIRTLGLDFYSVIKLVNYIRSNVKVGNINPDVSSRALFEDDRYLQPVLEDDALLFSVGDLVDMNAHEPVTTSISTGSKPTADPQTAAIEARLSQLQSEFNAYRAQVATTLNKRWEDSNTSAPEVSSSSSTNKEKPSETSYFDSYGYNDIHETMLRDTVRTDAYRDFIYDNKNLFAGKVVLDVGCGTGILSLLCAKAGASRVIAVDNSSIIDKARVNIHRNGMEKIITCLRGKIEEVVLPVPKVDIIVSEWMGYCLLFEAMLPSVLWARDQYLVPGGLMVPSHTTIRIAPVADCDFIADTFTFWKDVYGFDMSAMEERMYDDVLVTHLPTADIAGPSTTLRTLELHTVTKDQLDFSAGFTAQLAQRKQGGSLDGWCVWFDTFFLTTPSAQLSPEADAVGYKGGRGQVAFTTGPYGKETHWKAGVMALQKPVEVEAGASIQAEVVFSQGKENERDLDIQIKWAVDGGVQETQTWALR